MPQLSLKARVEILEKHVEVLSTLPSRMEAIEVQFVRLRDEVRAGFSAIDRRFETVDERFDGIDRRLDRMDQRFDGIDRRLDRMDQRFNGIDQRLDGLEQRLQQGDEDTRRYMRVLHEEVLARLTLLQEGRPPQP